MLHVLQKQAADILAPICNAIMVCHAGVLVIGLGYALVFHALCRGTVRGIAWITPAVYQLQPMHDIIVNIRVCRPMCLQMQVIRHVVRSRCSYAVARCCKPSREGIAIPHRSRQRADCLLAFVDYNALWINGTTIRIKVDGMRYLCSMGGHRHVAGHL